MWRRKINIEKVVTITRMTQDGDEVRQVSLKTLEAEKVLDMPMTTIINGQVVTTWEDLLKECAKTEEPQILQMPIVIGG